MSKKSRTDSRVTGGQSWIAGGIAGIIARTVTSPLEVVKVLAQVGIDDAKRGFVGSFSHIANNEGIKAFWKGNALACLRVLPYNGIQMGVYASSKEFVRDPVSGQINSFNSLLAGSFAGVVATSLTYPMDVLKTRMTLNSFDPYQQKYKSMLDAFTLIAKEEGFMALYKGISPTILGVIPFAGTLYFTYEQMDSYSQSPRERLSATQAFINGCVAGAVAQTVSFPFDTIRKKMQAQSLTVPLTMRPDVEFKGMVDCFVQTVNSNGVIGLWRGNAANLVRIVPYAGLMFATYEFFKKGFLFTNGYTTSPFSETPKVGVNQNLNPEDLKRYLRENASRAKDNL